MTCLITIVQPFPTGTRHLHGVIQLLVAGGAVLAAAVIDHLDGAALSDDLHAGLGAHEAVPPLHATWKTVATQTWLLWRGLAPQRMLLMATRRQLIRVHYMFAS